MPVPSTMADLATLASSNFPTGTESIGNSLDDYIRSLSAIIRSTNGLSAATIAAASTTDIASSTGETVNITGSATINSLGTGFPGCYREMRFSGVCTIVNSGSLIISGGGNIVTQALESITARCLGSGVWIVITGNYVKRSGDSMPGSLASAGTITGDSGNTGAVAALGVGSRAGFWDVLTANSANLRGVADPARGYLYFGNAKLYGVGVDPVSNALNLRTSGLAQIDTGGAGAAYLQYLNSTSWAQYKQAGGNGWYWRKNSTGTPTGTGNVDLATLDDSGNLTVAGTLISVSDERKKTAWEDLPDDFIEKLAAVKHGTYLRTDLDERQAGVSAQSMAAVMKLLAPTDEHGDMAVAYGNAALLAAIQLSKRVLALEGR